MEVLPGPLPDGRRSGGDEGLGSRLSFVQALLGSLLSYPVPVATLSFNPANGLQTAQIAAALADQLSDAGRATCTLDLHAYIVDWPGHRTSASLRLSDS